MVVGLSSSRAAQSNINTMRDFEGGLSQRNLFQQSQQRSAQEKDDHAEVPAPMNSIQRAMHLRSFSGHNQQNQSFAPSSAVRTPVTSTSTVSTMQRMFSTTIGINPNQHHGTAIVVMPPAQERILDGEVDKFLGDQFKRRHMVLTEKALYFGKPVESGIRATEDDMVLDKVLLSDITEMEGKTYEVYKRRSKAAGTSNLDPSGKIDLFPRSNEAAAAPTSRDADRLISLSTTNSNEHSSRTYVLRVDTAQLREKWLVLLELNIEKETKRAIRSHRLLHWQDRSRALFTNVCLRWFFAMAILASFIVDALETQYLPLGRGDDARGEIFFSLELAFTVLFAFELSWNMFSYWFWEFFSDSWSLFDFAVVVASIASVGSEGANVKSIRMVRVLRALRVVSQFKSLRKIVRALTQAIQPVISAMFVAVIAIAVFAILGVNFFAERSPVYFGDFGRACWTLGTAATMENWVNYVDDLMLGEPGTLDTGVIVFFTTYIIIVAYVLTSVVIAVLLENFSDASRAEEEADMLEAEARQTALAGMGNRSHKIKTGAPPLDPLLAELVQVETYEQLQAQLRTLFEVLDADGSNDLSYDEMQLGLQSLHLHPRIMLSYEDFREFTRDGTGLGEGGTMDEDHFVELMKLQIRDYIGRQMCRQATLPQNSRTVSSLFSAVNWLMMLSLASHGTNLAQSNVNMRADSGPLSGSSRPLLGRASFAGAHGTASKESIEDNVSKGVEPGVLRRNGSESSLGDSVIEEETGLDSALNTVRTYLDSINDNLEKKIQAAEDERRRFETRLETRVEERFQALESLIRQLVPDGSTSPSRLANSGAAQANGGTVVVLKQSPVTAQRMAPPRIAESGPMSATQASESLSPGPPKDVAHSADSANITVQTHAASPPARLKDLLSASQEITSKYRRPAAPGSAHDPSWSTPGSPAVALARANAAALNAAHRDVEISSLDATEFEAAMQRANTFLHELSTRKSRS